MKQTKKEYNLFSFYDRTGIQAHLEHMASEGWMIEKIGSVFWHYRYIEPQALHFAVTYFPQASAFDPEPSEKQQIFRDFCEHSGWKLTASTAQMEIYYNTAEHLVPIETDASVELRNIHKTAKKTILVSNITFLVLAILQLSMQIISFINNSIYALLHNTTIFLVFCWSIVLVTSIVELSSYFRWHKKAKIAAEENGSFVETHSHKTFQAVLLVILFIGFVFWMLTLGSGSDMTAAVFGIVLFSTLLLLVMGIKTFLKKKKVSAKVNRNITFAASFILSFVLMGLLVFFILNSVINGLFKEREPYKIYEFNGWTFEIYHDELPLRIEDLIETDYEDYSYEKYETESVFLSEIDVSQSAPHYAEDLPEMTYTITKVKVPFLYKLCFDEIYHRYDKWYGDNPSENKDYYVEIDAKPWDAVTAYQMYTIFPNDVPWNLYLICYEDRIIEFDPIGFELTPEQILIVAEKLRNI